MQKIRVLRLTLHDTLVGYLTGSQDGRNSLIFDEDFKFNPSRPTLSLTTRPDFPRVEKLLAEPWVTKQRLHPVLSNLLPEGALRELIVQGLKTHSDNEFQLFSFLGHDLPGALIAEPLAPDDVPISLITANSQVIAMTPFITQNRFSLAGVQIKFSMNEMDGRYQLAQSDALGDWIIKTPSTKHQNVPINEYTAMTLASLVGVDIPEIKLVEMDMLDNLPPINLPNERYAFGIKRFDRDNHHRIHSEDFAQVLVKYPHEKYNSANYEQIGKVLYQFTGNGIANAQQFARRLLVNILLGNGDAHIKNWSLLYSDRFTPELAPAYDIVTTNVYIEGEREYALNLGKTKQWYQVTLDHFETWARKSDIPWRVIKPHLDDTMAKARYLWPNALNELPMDDIHKEKLRMHWQALQKDFRI